MTATAIDALEAMAAANYSRPISAAEIESPDFDGAEWLVSWEWYVSPGLRSLWSALCTESRWIACLCAIDAWRSEL
jgi:hypothetical protein